MFHLSGFLKILNAPNLIVLDATIPKVGQNAVDLNQELGIKNSRFFDIKNVFSDKEAQFPNTLVSPEIFQKEAKKLGINKDSAIIVYDKHGIYSSPRASWLFKTMGHVNVAVLDGGLPEWKSNNYPTEKINKFDGELSDFEVNYQSKSIYNYNNVLNAISNKDKLILDARSADRFKGERPEPRESLRSGHIPNSKNLPYTELLEKGNMLSEPVLSQKFNTLISEESELVFSCGSGITACVLALGAEVAGYKNVSVYDGSWTEWGSLLELPVEK